MMTRSAWGLTLLMVGLGAPLLVAGAMVVIRCEFAAPPFVIALALHLLGGALCLAGYEVRPRPARIRRAGAQPMEAMNVAMPIVSDFARSARFGFGTQAIRLALAVVLAATVTAGLWLTQRDLNELFSLRRLGRVTQGQVFNKERKAQIGNAASGLVYYCYRVDRLSVTDRFRAARADYPLLPTGQHLTVTYLPKRPRIHRLGIVDVGRVQRECAAVLLLLLTALVDVGLPVIAVERELRRQLRLARNGVAANGVITGCKPILRRGRRVGYHVRYEVTTPEGAIIEDSARIGLYEGEPTLVGFPLTVLYDPKNPLYNRPLAAFRRVSFSRLPKTVLAI